MGVGLYTLDIAAGCPLLQNASMEGSESTIVFFPEGAFGPTNNCVGIGNVLRRRRHRVVFIIEESFAGTPEERVRGAV